MTPRGAWTKVTTDLAKIAKRGDLTDLRDYLASDVYAAVSAQVVPERRLALIQCAAKAMAQCHRRSVPTPPRPVSWDAAMVLQLRASWSKHKGDAYRVGRDLGITPGAAKTAYGRFVVAGTTPSPRKPPRKAQDGRSASAPPWGSADDDARVGRAQAA